MMNRIVSNRRETGRAVGAPRAALRRLSRTVVTLVLAASAMATVGVAGAQAAAPNAQGCPSGYACIYPQNAGWNNGRPSNRYYSYGAHNLSNQFGIHRVFNNQIAGAEVLFCTGYNGVNCSSPLRAGAHVDKNLTPINSIVLRRASGGPNQPV